MTNEANKVKLTREVLFEAIGSISEDMLLKSEQHLPKKEPTAKRITLLVSMAAAIFIVCGSIVFLGILSGPNRYKFFYPQEALSGGCYQESTSGAAKPNYSTSTSAASKKPTSQTNIENIFEWALVFNEIEEPPQGDRAYIPGYFEEKLTSDLLEKILPEKLHKGMINSAVAGFDGEGTLVNLTMRVAYLGYDGEIFINVSEDESILKDYIITDDEKISCFCNGIYFTCYNYSSDHYEIYEAEAEIHGLYYHFEIKSLYQNRTNAEKIMKLTMESFTTFETAPDLSLITPSYTPPYENYALPYESAKKDETFGKYLFDNMPEGFTEENTRRYIDSNENYLSTLYTKGLNEISYKVTFYDKETMGRRFTNVSDEKNYDLNLYPIPRAETVPEELMEIVNNPIFSLDELTLNTVLTRTYYVEDAGDVSGPRINFSVILDNENGETILIEIRSKGVDPQWLFDNLTKLL